MTDMLVQLAVVVSGSAWLSIVVKSTALLVVSLTITGAATAVRASVRHAILAALFGMLLALPIAVATAPPITIALTSHRTDFPPSLFLKPFDTGTSRSLTWQNTDRAAARGRTSATPSMRWLLLTVWAVGATLFAVPLMVGLWALRTVRRDGVPWPEGHMLLQRLAGPWVIRRPIEVLMHGHAAAPMTSGALHPMIVVPTDIDRWPVEHVEQALVHELEHIWRGDWLFGLLARAICIGYWFHPLVWIAWRRLNLEAERACDDAVLVTGDRTTYAQQLVDVAKRMSNGRLRPVLGMVNGSDLSARVGALLDSHQPRGRVGIRFIIAIGIGATILLLTVSGIHAVSTAGYQDLTRTQLPEFEVASVKPNKLGDLGPRQRPDIQVLPNGRFTATNMPLRALILYAWRLQMFEVSGGPGWVASDRFDIAARAPDGTAVDQVRPMLRALLWDRFNLRTHTESRAVPVFAMVMARPDRRLGPRLRRSTSNCVGAPQPTPGPPPDRNNPPCGFIGPSPSSDFPSGRAMMAFRGLTMEGLARFWSPGLQRMVINRTGLDGYFDGEFDPSAEFGPPPPPPGMPDPFDRASFPSAFTVLREELGLKLESTKAPVTVLIIDRAERPIND